MIMAEKPKIFNLKKFIKSENGRLQSLSSPRDLSLGGTKPKRVYAPNLNVIRNKTNDTVSTNKLKRPNAKRNNTPKHVNRATNNGRFVQSSGVFSEGTAFVKKPTLYSDKHATAREQDTSSGMIIPKLGNNWDIDMKEEATIVQDLLACDEDSGSDPEGEYEPIVLPLSANRDGFMNTFKVKKEINTKVIKTETNGVDIKTKLKEIHLSDHDIASSFSCGKVFDDENVSVSLIKMPDSLPGKGFNEEDKPIDYTLSQMVEGKIGKILVRKSGRVDVAIGKTIYTLDAVEAAQFTEELMCMSDENNLKNEAGIVNLGPINEKFVISPIWSKLLKK